MSWLNSVLVTPTIGLELRLPLKVDANKGYYCASLLDFMSTKGKPELLFEFQPKQNPLAIKVAEYTVILSRERLAVSYAYELKQVMDATGFPRLLLPEVIPFSELLDTSKSYFLEAAKCLESAGGTTFSFIGIAAQAQLNMDALPPGVEKFINYFGRLWDGILELELGKLTSRICENDTALDRCHHSCKFTSVKPEEGLFLKIDWQRAFKSEFLLSLRELSSKLDSSIESFLDYCEQFGEGNLNYEQPDS